MPDLPNSCIGGVHHGNENIEQQNDCDALVHRPHGQAHHVGELLRQTVHIKLILLVGVLVLIFGAAVGVVE